MGRYGQAAVKQPAQTQVKIESGRRVMSTSSLALLPLSCIAQLAECQSDKENIRLCGCGREAGIRTEHDPQVLNQTGDSS